jgi:UDP-N-acetylmuramoyl-tripeptide--D-alanyl-D-alanine ligase
MQVQEIVRAVNGFVDNQGFSLQQIKGVSIDSRTIKPGQLFIAIKGENFDGHDFIASAISRGAAAIIAEDAHRVKTEVHAAAIIVVKDTLNALMQLAAYHRQRFSIPVIAVTGSNGKTTTKDLIASVLAQRLNVLKSWKNYNNEIGLSLTLLGISKGTEAVVVEMGMRGLGQIAKLTEISRPTMGVITNVGPVHLELLKSLENIAAAKAELLKGIDCSGKAFLNAEDPWCLKMQNKLLPKSILYGFKQGCHYSAKLLDASFSGSKFLLIKGEQTNEVMLPIPGEHNVLNALAAAAVAGELGFDLDVISEGLFGSALSEKRLEILKGPLNTTIINDTYNANPVSVMASLSILAKAPAKRRIAVLGEMYELGDFEKQGHALVGASVHSNGIDCLIAIGKLARYIAEGAIAAGMPKSNVLVVGGNAEAISYLKKLIAAGDFILFKGSRSARVEEVVKGII